MNNNPQALIGVFFYGIEKKTRIIHLPLAKSIGDSECFLLSKKK
jgi:hypothetical protein